MIQPEPGRHVHFIPWTGTGYPDGLLAGQPHAAVIAHVHSDRMVNLMVIDSNGFPLSKTSVPLLQPDDLTPTGYDYCRWMPFTISSEQKRKQQDDTAKHAEALAGV